MPPRDRVTSTTTTTTTTTTTRAGTMTEQSTTRADAADAGCWVDGHWGHYGAARVVEIAVAHGWTDAEAAAIAADYLAAMGPSDHEPSDATIDAMIDASDDAERWLNANVAPLGYWFGWHDGEFFLSSDSWWSEDGGPWSEDGGPSEDDAR